MNDDVLEALNGSIKKWEKILDGTGIDDGSLNCPLCEMFWVVACEGCPVSEKTGMNFCGDSPYDDWSHHAHSSHDDIGRVLMCPDCERLAKLELEFLKSLLPTDI